MLSVTKERASTPLIFPLINVKYTIKTLILIYDGDLMTDINTGRSDRREAGDVHEI